MALIRHAQAKSLARDALVLDLGDLKRQADSLKGAAEDEAARIVREAHEERARILEGAHEKGHAEGYAEGLAKGENEGRDKGQREAHAEFTEKYKAIETAFDTALVEFEQARESLVLHAQEDGLRLVLEIARRITRRAVAIDPDSLRERIGEILARIIEPSRIVIRVHPDDVALAEEAAPAILSRLGHTPHAEVRADGSLTRGDAVIDSGRGSISAEIDTQLDRVLSELMPDHSTPADPSSSSEGAI